MRHIHLIGIGGSGLSAIAKVLLERGERVSGSDRQPSPVIRSLEAAGASVSIGHQAQNVQGADLVVRSSAVSDDNVEVTASHSMGIPVLKRAEFLPELLAGYQVVAVSGTHGKTTTTAMIAWLLSDLEMDPSYIIGGVSSNLGTNAYSGHGPHFVIEADEYDYMFLGLTPHIAVVTNIEYDHPDCFPTPQAYSQAFRLFAAHIESSGAIVVCMDDPGARQLAVDAASGGRNVYGYGFVDEDDASEMPYYAVNLAPIPGYGYEFEFYRAGEHLTEVSLPAPGMHNVLNAVAAMAVIDLLELPVSRAASALGEFRGTGRRFEIRGEARGITVIDDYAHHPTEIKSTLAAARAYYPQREIWAVWQPHTYSRTRMFTQDYIAAFDDADHVLVTEVYPSRESPPANGFSSRQLVDAMSHPGSHYTGDNSEAVNYLVGNLTDNSILIVLSAGDADQISDQVLNRLE